MAVKIKLKRMGKIHAPYYRIVVADARTKRDGRAIEEIGKYHPKSEPSFIEVSSPRAQYWLSVGAQPTEPVRRILEITGDWQKFRGEPGAEGTLRVAEPKAAKSERFAEAAGQAKTAERAPKGRARKARQRGQAGQGRRFRQAQAQDGQVRRGRPGGCPAGCRRVRAGWGRGCRRVRAGWAPRLPPSPAPGRAAAAAAEADRPGPRLPPRRPSRAAEAEVLEEALEHLVKGIVEHPDDVNVASRGLRRGHVLEVRVHPDDLGKVIGRGGRTARALRTVIGSLAGRQYVRVDLVDATEVR